MKTLITWLGQHDLGALTKDKTNGPIWSAVTKEKFETVIIISNYKSNSKEYKSHLEKNFKLKVKLHEVYLDDPTDLNSIYMLTKDVLLENSVENIEFENLFFLLSSGTWAMATNWILLSQSEFPSNLMQTALIDKKEIVKLVDVPFEISSRLLTKAIERQDASILSFQKYFNSNFNSNINWKTPEMVTLIKNSNTASNRFLPTLILGDQGTEKDSIANIIFEVNKQKAKNHKLFILDFNQLGEEEFINQLNEIYKSRPHMTVDKSDKNIPIMYLPDIEHLSIKAQRFVNSLLKDYFLEENFRSFHLISSSSDSLIEEMQNGKFDMTLFHRLAQLMLKIPSLKDRKPDLENLIYETLDKTNKVIFGEEITSFKKLTPSALGILKSHNWPGNIEELGSFFARLVAMNNEKLIDEASVLASLINFDTISNTKENILFKPMEDGIDLNEVIASVVQHYLPRAMDAANGSKIKAAKLLGFTNHQTMANWINRYNVNVSNRMSRG